jgi:hypothetical protein
MGCVSYLPGCFGSWAQEHGSKAIAACGWSKPSDQRLGACSCIHAASRVSRYCVSTAERLNGAGEHCCDELRLVNRRKRGIVGVVNRLAWAEQRSLISWPSAEISRGVAVARNRNPYLRDSIQYVYRFSAVVVANRLCRRLHPRTFFVAVRDMPA